MAEVLFKPSRSQFPAIGGFVKDSTGGISLEKWAMTFNMNELVGLGNLPPTESSHCSPWWLLITCPETWDPDFDDLVAHYIPRQNFFLAIFKDLENEVIQSGESLPSPRLSEHMARSLDKGDF
ncbi:hypothetical protein BJX99DRAFT_264761 [Aspergillus californicus]